MKNLRVFVVVVICACLCVGYYFYLSNRSNEKSDEPTELDQLISKDLDHAYPSTPREVVKYYNRILMCLYNEEYSDEQYKALGYQARMLIDDELLASNPEDAYFSNLNMDLNDAAQSGTKVSSPSVSNSKEVVYKEVQGHECAYVDASYFIKGKDASGRIYQTYVLRKSEDGRWKILGSYSQG